MIQCISIEIPGILDCQSVVLTMDLYKQDFESLVETIFHSQVPFYREDFQPWVLPTQHPFRHP